MRHLGILEAKTEFSSIVAEVERTGEEVVVTRYGKAAVRIVPADPSRVGDAGAIRRLIDGINARRGAATGAASIEELNDLLDRDRDDRWL